MSWTTFRETVTVIDVLEGGACIEGVCEYVGKNLSIIGPPVDDRKTGDHLKRAANADGSGSGDGYGDGYGSGYGSGDGYGDGYGYGYGDGYGDGSGS